MAHHSGSARDPLTTERSSNSQTPGMGLVIAGFVIVCLVVAVANMSGGWLQNSIAHVAQSVSAQG